MHYVYIFFLIDCYYMAVEFQISRYRIFGLFDHYRIQAGIYIMQNGRGGGVVAGEENQI